MTLFLILLYALVLPYIGLMLMVIVGLLRRERPPAKRRHPDGQRNYPGSQRRG